MASATTAIAERLFLRATRKGKDIYVRCTERNHAHITDHLIDNNFVLQACESWEFMRAIERRSDCFDFDDEDILDF